MVRASRSIRSHVRPNNSALRAKTRRSRVIEITAQTVDRLRAHRRGQNELKMANRTTYADFDLVFAREERDRRPGTRLGEPIKTLSEHRFQALA
jgi:hypothetical protein